jgi:hypothetical protein
MIIDDIRRPPVTAIQWTQFVRSQWDGLQSLRADSKSPSTIRKAYQTLAAVLAEAELSNRITSDSRLPD